MAAGTPQNYYVKGQAPLDSKMVFANIAVLLNYISDNPLYAFNFYKGMIVYLQEEKAFYIWENPFSKEFAEKESLLIDNFIYPPGSVYENVNYSGQAFNLIDYYYSKIDIGSWSEDDKTVEVTIQEGSNVNPFVVQDVLDLWPNAERISFIGDDTTGLKLYGSPIQLYQEFPVADWASLTYDISNSQDDYVQIARIRILEPGEVFDYIEYQNLIVGNSFKEIQIVYSAERMNKKSSMYFKPITEGLFEMYVLDTNGDPRKIGSQMSFENLTPEQQEALRGEQGIQGEQGEKGDNANPIIGNAKQSNAPYNLEDFESYKVVEPISTSSAWYAAASAPEQAKFPITQPMLEGNSIFFDVENGVVSVFTQPILKGDDGADGEKIEIFNPLIPYEIGVNINYKEKLYKINTLTSAGETPEGGSSYKFDFVAKLGNMFPFVNGSNNVSVTKAEQSITEIYIENYSDDFDYYLGTIRKNVDLGGSYAPNRYDVSIIKTTAGTTTIVNRYTWTDYGIDESERAIVELRRDGVATERAFVAINWATLDDGFSIDLDPDGRFLLSKKIEFLNESPVIKIELLEASSGITEAFADNRYAFKNTTAYNYAQSDSRFVQIGSLTNANFQIVNAGDFGYLPSATVSEQMTALQTALNGGNKTVIVSVAGTYKYNTTIYLDDNTTLIYLRGTKIEKVGSIDFAFANRGILTRTRNYNITLDGIDIRTVGFETIDENFASYKFGMRGHLTFWKVDNLTIRNFTCLEFETAQWPIQVASFNNLLIENFHLQGEKDGIHLGGKSKKAIIRNGITKCYDDAVAINAFDYAISNPEIGDIEDITVENVEDQYNPTWGGYGSKFSLMLVGTPVPWTSGINIRNGDAVTNGGKTYIASTGTIAGTDFSSTTAPNIATFNTIQVSEGITWKKISDIAVLSANVTDIKFKNITHKSPNQGVLIGVCNDETGTYSRTVHPNVLPENYPKASFLLENVVTQRGQVEVYNKIIADLTIKNVRERASGSAFLSCEQTSNLGSRILLDNVEMRSDNYYYMGDGIDFIIKDCPTIGIPNISSTGRLRSNIPINHGDLPSLNPQKGDQLNVNGTLKVRGSSSWIDLN